MWQKYCSLAESWRLRRAIRSSTNLPTEMMRQGPGTVAAHEVNAIAGIRWSRPEHWSVQPPRQMRIATYAVPAVQGDAEGAECAVFYFGSGQGGDVDANIDRWVKQFENAGQAERSSKEINGLNIVLVRIEGAYLAPSGPMMQSQGKKENYRLLGAIVEAPEGMVFFKCTGPVRTTVATEDDFNLLVNSVVKQ